MPNWLTVVPICYFSDLGGWTTVAPGEAHFNNSVLSQPLSDTVPPSEHYDEAEKPPAAVVTKVYETIVDLDEENGFTAVGDGAEI